MRSDHIGMFVAAALLAAPASASAQTLDYGFFKTRVEPIFLKKRPDHVRCYVWQSESSSAFKLEKLPPGSKVWDEEQSRKIFEMASKLVVPGNPDASQLLRQPLAPQAGGNAYHSGGRQFSSKDEPEWKTLAAWVNGQKAATK